MTHKEYENEIGLLLNEMDEWQLGKFLTVLSFRSVVHFSEEFLEIADREDVRYLNPLLFSLMLNYAIFFSKDKSDHALALALGRAFNRDIALDRVLALALALAIDRVRILDRALALDRAFAQDRDNDNDIALTLARDRTRAITPNCDHVPALALVRDHVFALVRTLARAIDLDLIISNANSIVKNSNVFAQNEEKFPAQHNALEQFLLKLRELGGEEWSNLFERTEKNNFKMSKDDIEMVLNIPVLDTTIVVTSEYFKLSQKGTELFDEARLIVLGDKCSGKTAFTKRFQKLDDKMPPKDDSTPGIDRYSVKASAINPKYRKTEKDYTINIWDFAGHSVTHAAHKLFLSDVAVYVIVLRGRTESVTQLNEWLEHIKYYAHGLNEEKIKVYILANKEDDNIPPINYDLEYKKNFNIEKDFFIDLKKDNKVGGSLDKFRNRIVEHIVNSPQNKKVPTSIIEIKQEIEALKNNHYTPVETIEAIINKYDPSANAKNVLRILHSYGICFYYEKLEGDDGGEINPHAIVLNPRWTIFVIYRLINFIQNDGRKDGHIHVDEFEKAFTNSKKSKEKEQIVVDTGMYDFISRLAQKFGLAYMKNDLLIFPICLEDNYPHGAESLIGNSEEDFMVTITAKTRFGTTCPTKFPKDIIPALIVKRYRDLSHLEALGNAPHCSRKGAVFQKEKVKAEVKRITDTEIVVLVKGNNVASCEFGARLVADLYNVIKKYPWFQQEEPVVKIVFIDKGGDEKNELLKEFLENDDLMKKMATPTIFEKLKKMASKIPQIYTLIGTGRQSQQSILKQSLKSQKKKKTTRKMKTTRKNRLPRFKIHPPLS